MRPLETELLDPLTGTYSRASLKNRLQEEVDRSLRYGQPFTILLLDLDHFKSVNDAFGHRRGDDILIAFAQRLKDHARKSDIVFRYGGDEFILLLPSTEKSDAIGLASRLFDGLTNREYTGNPPIKLTSSMGIASFPSDADSPEGLFDTADKRHYQAKRLGRSRIVSGESEEQPGNTFDQSSRVIEREISLERVYAFFEALARNKQGTLSVSGPPGVGKTRFLEEVAKIARLHGHLVLPLSGKHSRKSRALGAILEAEQEWEGLISITSGEYAFIRSLDQLLGDKGNIGLIFTIDNLVEVDRQSLSTIERIFYSPSLPRVAIAYSDGDDSNLPYFTESPLTETVQLQAFSEEGVLVWLRHMLRWEPPKTFVRWLHAETRGLPDFLRRSLSILQEEGFLQFDEGWTLVEDNGSGHYQNLPLAMSLDRSRRMATGNLPLDLPTFIGRTAELKRLKLTLRDSRVVTVTGPGGVGKSRLALQAAIEVEEEFPDGAFLVPIAPADPGGFEDMVDHLVSAVASVIGISLTGKTPGLQQIREYFKSKRLLIQLNNYEDLDDCNGLIENILETAPRVRFLLTSRRPTGIAGEAVFELGGMSIPTSDDAPGGRHYEAVQLFLVHARRANPEFTLTDRNLSHVIKICQLVGGMPLGIELAAVWVSMFSPEELAAQIEYNYRFISAESSGVILQKRNIQAVFDYFWGLLSETERSVLARLTVFQGEFSREAASAVAGASPFFLDGLTNRVFLSRSTGEHYLMHNLLRRYAAEKLTGELDQEHEAYLSHSAYYLDFLESRTQHLRGNKQEEAQVAIGQAFPNIQAAWNWAIQHREYELVRDAVDALYLYSENRGSFREADLIFATSVAMLEEATPETDRSDPAFKTAYSRVKLRAAIFRSMVGFIKEARDSVVECLGAAEDAGDLEEIALCYEHLGWVNYDLGLPHNEIRDLWEKSLEIYRERDIPWGISRLLYNLSFISSVKESRALMHEKLEISTRIGDLIGLADTLLTLGEIHQKLGESTQAFDYYQQSKDIYEQLGNQDGTAFSHFGRGDVFLNLGQYETALASFETAHYIFRQTGNLNGLSTSLARICRSAMAMGEFKRARRGLEESLALEEGAGSRIGAAYSLNYQGELDMIESDLLAARLKLEDSCRIIRQAEDTWGLGRVLSTLARLEALEDRFDRAVKTGKEGLAISRMMGETAFVHANLLALGHARLGQGQHAAACGYFREALLLADKHHFPPLLLESLLGFAALFKALELDARAEPLLRMIRGNPASSFPVARTADMMLADIQPGPKSPNGEFDLDQYVREIAAWKLNG